MPGISDASRGTRDVTRLLEAYGRGDHEALNELIPLVYGSLRDVARRQLRAERPDHTLSSTALVHEAYLELARLGDVEYKDRSHFLAAAARTMRHILIDYAVNRKALKRGGNRHRVPLEESLACSDENVEELIALNDALRRLEGLEDRLVRIVECRFFAGLSIEETAQALSVSEATVSRGWTRARAWLNRELGSERGR
jgi:RNA polymerase sigma factor (TIGR02999 family)